MLNYFKALGILFVSTFTGARDPRTGRIVSFKSLRAVRQQMGAVVFTNLDSYALKAEKVEEALLNGYDVLVSADGGHLELYAPAPFVKK